MPSSGPNDPLPKLRRLEIVPVRTGNQSMFALRDPSGFTEETVAVTPGAMLILQLLDGEHTMRQVQTELMRRTGELVRSDQIERMIEQFDRLFLLQTPGFEAHRRRRLEAYRAEGVRRCRHVEGGYPSDPVQFARMVEGWMGDLRERASPSRGRLVGAIAPHIDFGRGSVSYAHAYRDLAACPADLFVILGTDHFGDTLFAATRNDFETPLGRVPVARDVLERIEAAFIGDLRDGELQHLGEHTIEFQVVLLQHFLGGRPFEIVPLLCGGLQEEMEAGVPASENAEVHSLVECLREIAAGGERSVCVLASADLSHVGPNFGGDRPLTPGYLEKIADFDREILASAVAGDPDGMFRLVAGRRNDTNICGLSPMYVMVSALGACRGQLLDYRQATAPDRKQSVTFAAATFWR